MASKTSDSSQATHQMSQTSHEDVNYASKLHPDVQRGTATAQSDAKPVFDMSALGNVEPLKSTPQSLSLGSSIAEADEESSNEDGDDANDSSKPFVVNGSGDPTQNKYPHPTLGQLAKSDLQGSSEVLTASLIEIRKHPGTLIFIFLTSSHSLSGLQAQILAFCFRGGNFPHDPSYIAKFCSQIANCRFI